LRTQFIKKKNEYVVWSTLVNARF